MRGVLTGYRDHVPQPAASSAGPALTSAWDLVEKALAHVPLRQGDIGGAGHVEFAESSLVVLSYVLNDLHEQGRVETFETRLTGLGEGSLLIVLESGSKFPGDARSGRMPWLVTSEGSSGKGRRQVTIVPEPISVDFLVGTIGWEEPRSATGAILRNVRLLRSL
jgi:hypothetical protein